MSQIETAVRYSKTTVRFSLAILALAAVVEVAWVSGLTYVAGRYLWMSIFA